MSSTAPKSATFASMPARFVPLGLMRTDKTANGTASTSSVSSTATTIHVRARTCSRFVTGSTAQ